MMKLVQDTLSRFVSSGQIAGCSAKIIRNGETCFEGCFGYADIEKKIKITDQTIFRIASMSKVITVAGLMRLYEQGLFKLWDLVSEYLPGFKNPTIAKEKPDGTSVWRRKKNMPPRANLSLILSRIVTWSARFLWPLSQARSGCTASPSTYWVP